MNTFKDILTTKYEQLGEDAAGAAAAAAAQLQASQAGQAEQPGQVVANDPNNSQTQPQNASPEQKLVDAFTNMDFKNSEVAIATLNTAMKNLNNQDANAFWGNVGYDPAQGFVAATGSQQQPGATPQVTAAQQAGTAQQVTPTTAQSQSARKPSIGA